MKRIAILGSTGSIGCSALSVVDLYPERFRIIGLAAQRNASALYEQCQKYQPLLASLSDESAASELRTQLPGLDVRSGIQGVAEVACHPDVDIVLSAITGAAGLVPTHRAIVESKDIALANKETLVMAGNLLMPLIEERGLRLLPVDSEHSALHQCLRGSRMNEVNRLLLTASGGPFLSKSRDQLAEVTVEEALNHPTWDMGPKITVDSATLMNKGLEVIEAHYLFKTPPSRIGVVIHPQSVVHSLVEFIDGTLLAQMSITDMRTAILYALSYPHRWESNLPFLDVCAMPPMEFLPPDTQRFPCLQLAFDALKEGGTHPVVLNAANEVAVESFLRQEIPFLGIPRVIASALDRHSPTAAGDLETILEIDRECRALSRELTKDEKMRG